MDLRVASASRAADRLILLPPFPPAAERWAFTWVESIICVSPARPRDASSLNNRSHAPLRPTHEAVVDRWVWTILGGTVAPSTTTLQNMKDAADHAAIVGPRYATHIFRQERLNSRPLRIGQPEQIGSHDDSPAAAGENRHLTDSARQL